MWVGWVAFLLAVVGGLVFFLRGGPGALETGDKIGSIGSLVFGAVSLVVAVVTWRAGNQASAEDPAVLLERAAAELARLVGTQWLREAQRRELLLPVPMRIPWASTTRPVSAPVGEIVAPMPGSRPTRLRLHGYIGEVAATWRRLPARQLVVIGPPASGKTSLAVLFVREVLAERTSAEPVPVLLNLAGWNPTTTHLDTWLVRRLNTDYPQLTSRGFGEDAAVRLVDRRRIIPVLDGLDEMPEALRPLAVTALNQAIAGDRPLVLTSRTDEFAATIAATGTPLGRAAVVELAPLSGDGITDYLPAGQIDGAVRWAAVLARLAAEPDGALATVLSNPLMAYLARTAYGAPDTDPGMLLTFNTVLEVEEHLFGAYLPMVYRPGLPEPDEEPLRVYRTEDAWRWLSVIAGQLQRKGKRSLCLWRLKEIRPSVRQSFGMLWRSWRGLLLAGGFAFLSVGLVIAARTGLLIPVLGVLVVLLVSFWEKQNVWPARAHLRPMPVALSLLLLAGLGVSLAYLDRVVSGPVVLAAAVVFRIASTKLDRFVLIGLVDISPGNVVLSPVSALRRDREAFLVVLACAGVLTVFIALTEPADAVAGAVAAFVIMSVNVGSAWGNWTTGRTWLALLGLLPWRLLPFIEDAHQRGVLRVVGTEYQFRHARLQEYLSRPYPTDATRSNRASEV